MRTALVLAALTLRFSTSLQKSSAKKPTLTDFTMSCGTTTQARCVYFYALAVEVADPHVTFMSLGSEDACCLVLKLSFILSTRCHSSDLISFQLQSSAAGQLFLESCSTTIVNSVLGCRTMASPH